MEYIVRILYVCTLGNPVFNNKFVICNFKIEKIFIMKVFQFHYYNLKYEFAEAVRYVITLIAWHVFPIEVRSKRNI